MPLHYMQAIRLPILVVWHLEGMRRNFFWKGKDKCLGGHCLVNWSKCCLPKENGGLGIISLDLQNQALLIKWLWKLKAEQNSLWTNTVRELYGTTDIDALPNIAHISVGFKDILLCKEFFSASILASADPSQAWRWTPGGYFTSSSAYKAMANTGVRSQFQNWLWKIKAPPKVKVFLWLLLQERLLTQDNLLLRGWPNIQSCTNCRTPVVETATHLFIHCPFAQSFWDSIQIHFNLRIINFATNLVDFWIHNRSIIGKQWDIIWAAVSWALWKERNARIFSDQTSNHFTLLREVVENIDSWTLNA
ncbi:hypothetical protein LUZ63_001919 [Rhynchospora breviuscula]|uniref:Reverse transcriptase zinc-binding domain-containing protein n=1 Tax=Rhynchospora breviuscula TaxID=2022672 RepID=A0A9Q0CYA4_9POAL|nr:hypothetical protein LUZ63_001919 [Rhynchospora breviuscula]